MTTGVISPPATNPRKDLALEINSLLKTKDTVIIRGRICVDDTVVIPPGGKKLTVENPGDGIDILTTWGVRPTDKTYVRNRMGIHVGSGSQVCNVTLKGPRPDNSGRSPDQLPDGTPSPDSAENQIGIAAKSQIAVEINDCEVHNVWGPALGFSSALPGDKHKNTQQVTVRNIKFSQTGRHGMDLNGVNDLTVDGWEAWDLISSVIHVETGSNPLSAQKNLFFRNGFIHGLGGDCFHASTSGAPYDGIYFERNIVSDRPFRFHIDPGPNRSSHVYIRDNVWDYPMNEVANIWKTDVIDFTGNTGVLRWDGYIFDKDAIKTCTMVRNESNTITKKPRF